MELKDKIAEYGLNESQYEAVLKACSDKMDGDIDLDWDEIVSKYNLNIHRDSLRKASQTIFGGVFVRKYFENKGITPTDTSVIDNKIRELRKERMKLQTANIERDRLDRKEARHELYYEQIGSACKSLPVPEFYPLPVLREEAPTYIVTISDTHYGAKFQSEHNDYSPEVFQKRLEYLTGKLLRFIEQKGIDKLIVASLGDSLQGIIHLTDLSINDTSVVKSVVNYSRIIAQFLNYLSQYVNVVYYHVPSANHTQIRPLGTRASEIASEDLEYVIGNYIKDLLAENSRVDVRLAEEGSQYVKIEDVEGFDIYAMHGHQIKNIKSSVRDLASFINGNVDYLLMGHYHSGGETIVAEDVTYDCEVLVSPSFIGSDPYSDSLMLGSKGAVKIYGFDRLHGHTESYKIVLN